MNPKEGSTLPRAYRVLIHILLWLVFIQIIFDIGGLYYYLTQVISIKETKLDDAFLAIPFMILLFYGNALWLIPRFLKKGNWLKYLASFSIAYTVWSLGLYSLFIWIEHLGYVFRIDRHEFLDGMFMISILVVLGSLSWSFAKIALQNSQKETLAKQKQQEAELKVLVAQFNPHFLFNTLNGLYGLSSSENAQQTTEAILKLSEIMRYPINKGTNKTVALSEEIDFISDYIDLQKLRFGEDYPIHFLKTHPIGEVEIMPLTFMPLVENAFKYGVSQRNKTPIHLSLTVKDGTLNFTVENEIILDKNVPSFKMGIENLKARLEIVHPDKYSIDLSQTERTYRATLNIQLTGLATP